MGNFSLGEAVLGTAMDLAGLRKGMGQAEGESKSLWSKIGSIGEKALGVLTGNLATKGFDALLGAVQSVGDTLLNEAPRVEGLRTSFDNLAESAGFSGEAVMDSLRAAAKGMVTDVSLMESFNKSMLLVGEGMADKLPKLLEIAQASAAATGEDVGFMLDSLVTGIGRGSPMILDNLGLTINLSEAYEGYAKTLGISADEMTKAQQQMALLNAVEASGDEFIRRLGDNTGGTAQTMAQFKTTIENLKMGLATGLLPALTAIVTPLANLAAKHLPALIPLVEKFGAVFGAFIAVVLSGSDPLTSFASMLAMLGVPSEVVNGFREIATIINRIGEAFTYLIQRVSGWGLESLFVTFEDGSSILQGFFEKLGLSESTSQFLANMVQQVASLFTGTLIPAVQQVITWLKEFATTIGVFVQEHGPAIIGAITAIGAILAGAAIATTIASVVAAIAALFNPITLIIGAAALLGAAWVGNWGGIRDIVIPIVQQLATWFTGTLIPAVQQLAAWFTGTLVPAVQQVASWFQTVLFPALQQVWAFVQNNQLPLFMALADLLKTTLTVAVTALAGIWQNVLLPALKEAGKWIGDTFGPILKTFVEWLGKVTGGAEGISSAFEKVLGWVQNLTEKLKTIELPKWMTPGSPTPWELGLRGVAEALNEVNNAQLPQLGAGMGGLPTPALAGAGAMAGGGGISINFNGNMTLDNPQRVRDLAEEISRVLGEQLQSRRL